MSAPAFRMLFKHQPRLNMRALDQVRSVARTEGVVCEQLDQPLPPRVLVVP
jgi:hypothetical protein